MPRIFSLSLLAIVFMSMPLLAESPLPAPARFYDANHQQVSRLIESTDRHASFDHPFLPPTRLPRPHETPRAPKNLSLKEAILLALRNNPTVENSELERVTDKFNLEIAYKKFRPSYTFKTTAFYPNVAKSEYNVDASISYLYPVGTQLEVDYNNTLRGETGTASISVTQPLLKGFGLVNLVSLKDAIDNERVAKLTFENSIITVVNDVITKYRSLVTDYNRLRIQRRTLRQREETARQSELKVKAGKIPPSDLVEQQANVETTRLALKQQESQLIINYQTFLSSLGLTPTAKLEIDRNINFKFYKVPDKKTAIHLALEGNTDYQQSVIRLNNTRRAVITARDERQWQLDLKFSGTVGQTAVNGGFQTADNGIDKLITLSIPIDDIQAKADLVNAQIALETAELDLEQKKEDLIRSVITQLDVIENQRQQVLISENAIKLKQQTLNAAKIRLRFGKATVFEVEQVQDELLQQETDLVDTKILYLNDITKLNDIMGVTLQKWNIKLDY